MSCVNKGFSIWIQCSRPWMNKLRRFRTNYLICNMEGMTKAKFKAFISNFWLTFLNNLFSFMFIFNPSIFRFVDTNRWRSELWVVMF